MRTCTNNNQAHVIPFYETNLSGQNLKFEIFNEIEN